MAKLRVDQELSSTWDLKKIYTSDDEWKENFDKLAKLAKSDFSDINQFKEKLSNKRENLENCLHSYFTTSRALEKLYVYAHLKKDEDLLNNTYKEMYEKISALFHDFSHKTSWIDSEILEMEKPFEIPEYQFYLEKLFRQKKHVLGKKEEEIIALSGQVRSAPQKAFSLFNNADLVFPEIKDQNGEKKELTHALYQKYMKSEDRELRENAFKAMHESYHKYENTITELVSGQIQNHIFIQKARNYGSCLESAIKPHHIPVEVYKNLIKTVKENLHLLHDYVKIRKETLKVKELHYYDLSVPLVKDCDKHFPYDDAVDLVVDSVDILGDEYKSRLYKGMKEDRWVDAYENKGKRSGAYSSGSYETMPYILMNYQGTISDVLTLSHEAGHSMHSLYSNLNQPYHYAHYPIFLAEIASTFHERLTYEHLLKQMGSEKERQYILNQQIEGIRSTFFRQTMFAEFELKMHELAENHIPITADRLKEEYRKLNIEYFGKDLVLDKEIQYEYLRIPHFYYNFYVYQYATGIAAAYALVDIVKEEGPKRYLKFLSSGASNYPVELLKDAGLDITKEESLLNLLNFWKKLLVKK
jgi:oligoendopeptidase F